MNSKQHYSRSQHSISAYCAFLLAEAQNQPNREFPTGVVEWFTRLLGQPLLHYVQLISLVKRWWVGSSLKRRIADDYSVESRILWSSSQCNNSHKITVHGVRA